MILDRLRQLLRDSCLDGMEREREKCFKATTRRSEKRESESESKSESRSERLAW